MPRVQEIPKIDHDLHSRSKGTRTDREECQDRYRELQSNCRFPVLEEPDRIPNQKTWSGQQLLPSQESVHITMQEE